jgi:hypothetical protein
MLGLFKKAPKLEARFTPRTAVARELAKQVEVTGELVLRNVGKDVELRDLETVLICGGTRRIDIELPSAWRGAQRIPAGGELRASVAWTVGVVAPVRAPAAAIQINTTTGGKITPLAATDRFPLANE